ncbi:hypothetical protein [Micromonospora peucetia]|uniref:DUF2188 domain-containing protein n=1 Tax=Micromonospora peucetia TaxID=47871 RepID=A0ABZ1EJW4_9ACTN|nr:hypothetical protein [Micromonospora peucetia]WSA34568.1 hypothetical protein OIE14_11240 [Micromonospora peucetia]
MPMIPDDPIQDYRVDIHTGSKQTGIHHFESTESQASDTARRIVASLGGDHGDVYVSNGVGGATYYDTVAVQ